MPHDIMIGQNVSGSLLSIGFPVDSISLRYRAGVRIQNSSAYWEVITGCSFSESGKPGVKASNIASLSGGGNLTAWKFMPGVQAWAEDCDRPGHLYVMWSERSGTPHYFLGQVASWEQGMGVKRLPMIGARKQNFIPIAIKNVGFSRISDSFGGQKMLRNEGLAIEIQ